MKHTAEEVRQMEHEHIKFSYDQIGECLYAGNNLCCQGHFEMELLSKGVSADISLEAENLDNPQGVKYFFWFPWIEDTAPSTELVRIALSSLDMLINNNIKTYVHCKNGHGRTTLFLAAYFMRKDKISAEKALEIVRQKRPSGHINAPQRNFLDKLERIDHG